jgi:hypothetical protein
MYCQAERSYTATKSFAASTRRSTRVTRTTPTDLPVQEPVKFEIAVNARTATVPPSILVCADEVMLASRALLVKIKRDLENQIRGLLKNVGLVIGRAKFNVFAVRAEELIEDRPELIAVVGPLLKARQAIKQQTERCSQLSLLIEVKLTLSRSSRSLFSDDHKRCPSTPGRSCQNSERV